MSLPVVDEDEVRQDAPMTLAAAETSPDTGREPKRQRTPLAALSPLSETGASCADAGPATPTVRMAAGAAPLSKIRQLYTKRSISMW
jgi:hypothetical protein